MTSIDLIIPSKKERLKRIELETSTMAIDRIPTLSRRNVKRKKNSSFLLFSPKKIQSTLNRLVKWEDTLHRQLKKSFFKNKKWNMKKTRKLALSFLVLAGFSSSAYHYMEKKELENQYAELIQAYESKIQADMQKKNMAVMETKEERLDKLHVAANEKQPKTSGEQRFVQLAQKTNQMRGVFLDESILRLIYRYSMELDVPPFLVLGIGWKESKFDAGAAGPETSRNRGFAKGMFQFMDDTIQALGFAPKDAYDPKIAAKLAPMLIKEYSSWFAGQKVMMRMPDGFKNFKADGQYALYYRNGKWIPVTDQNEKKLSRLLLATASYNCGPGYAMWAMEKYGKIYVTPNDERQTFPHQTLAYIRLIGEKYYNFEYDFAYQLKDVNLKKAAQNM